MKHVLLVALFFFINIHIANAQVAFDEYVNNPVFAYSGVSGTFDQNRVYSHDTLKVDGEYKMYYSGVGGSNSVQIGLATSLDGINWERYPNNPIFKCAENLGLCSFSGGWSGYRVSVVSVDYLDGEYRLWYRGDNTSSNPIVNLGYATSQDGINWVAYEANPIFPLQQQSGVIYHSVLRIDAGYRLYYTDFVNTGYYYVDSPDGIDWTAPVTKIGSELVHSVDNIGDKFIAAIGSSVAVSDDGLGFDFVNPVATIQNNPGPDESQISFMLEDDLIKSWRVNYDGKVIWNFGNFSIHYATIQSEDVFGDGPDEPNPYPLYTQIKSPYPSLLATEEWAGEEYANGVQGWCGDTIGECGCVLTSLVMAGRNAGIEKDILGDDVNPSNMNNYLESVEGYTSGGSLRWLAAQAYLGELTGSGKIASRFYTKVQNPADGATMALIDEKLSAGNHAVLGYKSGHYVWLPEKTADSYVVQDPWWYNTQTANDVVLEGSEYVRDYNNSFTDARIIEILDEPREFSGRDIEVHLTGTAELLFTKATGEQVGLTDGGVVVDLERASYGNTEIISLFGENTNGGKHLLVYEAGEEFILEVVGIEKGEFTLEFFSISETGEVTTFEFSGETLPGVVTTFTFNLETGEVVESPIDYEQFLAIVSVLLVDASPQDRAFFLRWAEKIFNNLEEKTITQTLQSIEVFNKLLVAKKLDTPSFTKVLDKLSSQFSL